MENNNHFSIEIKSYILAFELKIVSKKFNRIRNNSALFFENTLFLFRNSRIFQQAFDLRFLIVTLFISGCAKEDVTQNEIIQEFDKGTTIIRNDFVYTDDFIDDEEVYRFLLRVENENLIFDKRINIDGILSPGKILASIGNRRYDSFLKKIISVEKSGKELIVTTVNASFKEAFKYLDLAVIYTHDGSLDFRTISVATPFQTTIPLGNNGEFTVSPKFGYEGRILIEVVINAADSTKQGIRMSLDNFKAKVELEMETFAFAEAKLERTFPFNIPISIKIPKPPISLDFRGVFEPKIESKTRFGLHTIFTLQTPPVNATVEINPYQNTSFPYGSASSSPSNFNINDLESNFEILDIIGTTSLELSTPVKLQMAPYRLFDIGNIFIELVMNGLEITGNPQQNQNGFEYIVNGKYKGQFSMGAEAALFKHIIGVDIPTKAEFKLLEWEYPLVEKTFAFNCPVSYQQIHFVQQCTEINGLSHVQYQFRITTNSSQAQNFQLLVNDTDYGTFNYNQGYISSIPSSDLPYSTQVVLRDKDNIGCRLQYNLINPCALIRNCQHSSITDSRDGQTYCTVNLNNQTWLSTNLNYSEGESIGFCHNDDPLKCIEIGRYYKFEQAQNICPQGWRLPSIVDWRNLRNNINWQQLYKPGISEFGNTSQGNGFDIVPTGQYQTYIDKGNNKPFTSGSIYDNGPKIAFFWTNNSLLDPNNPFSEEGAWAVSFDAKGTFNTVKMNRNIGLHCRCIKN